MQATGSARYTDREGVRFAAVILRGGRARRQRKTWMQVLLLQKTILKVIWFTLGFDFERGTKHDTPEQFGR